MAMVSSGQLSGQHSGVLSVAPGQHAVESVSIAHVCSWNALLLQFEFLLFLYSVADFNHLHMSDDCHIFEYLFIIHYC